jgi:amidohydrolase
MLKIAVLLLSMPALFAGPAVSAADAPLSAEIDRLAEQVQPHVVANRRYLHQHPELGNRETETAKYIAKKLKSLGLEVQTGIARTGVVGVLKGGLPGRVVALRSELDALPVTEEVDLPFKSTVKTTYDGKDVGVMHACGHDAHMGVLLGVAEVLAALKDRLPGTVKFIFQPAEEGAPKGEEGGAALMIKEGVLTREPKPEAIFALHVFNDMDVGTVRVRPGGYMASADDLKIVVRGRGTHGAAPWLGVDPIVVASQIVMGLQTIASRQMNLTKAPVIVTIGKIEGGVRNNVISDEATLVGTLRALDPDMRKDLHERVKRTAEKIAESAGASADVTIGGLTAYPVTVNDPKLTAQMMPTLQRVAGPGRVIEGFTMGAEDFSFFAQQIPGLYVHVGIRTPGAKPEDFPSNHSARFHIDESGLTLGVRTLANLAVDYLQGQPSPAR